MRSNSTYNGSFFLRNLAYFIFILVKTYWIIRGNHLTSHNIKKKTEYRHVDYQKYLQKTRCPINLWICFSVGKVFKGYLKAYLAIVLSIQYAAYPARTMPNSRMWTQKLHVSKFDTLEISLKSPKTHVLVEKIESLLTLYNDNGVLN